MTKSTDQPFIRFVRFLEGLKAYGLLIGIPGVVIGGMLLWRGPARDSQITLLENGQPMTNVTFCFSPLAGEFEERELKMNEKGEATLPGQFTGQMILCMIKKNGTNYHNLLIHKKVEDYSVNFLTNGVFILITKSGIFGSSSQRSFETNMSPTIMSVL